MAHQVIDICAAADLSDGNAVRFDVSIGGRPASAFVVRHRGVVAAFLNRCSHASTELDWQPGRFFD
ncbi:MAG TPA: Rieske 2Fe-2S domain-containing protein, partial [Burkholderiaceae bacterium]|nr:Rieske 2Fe-2S domain-containing protein [Burkholderiaceae bacterium]